MQNVPSRLTQVFWGLAIIGVDLNIRGFDILPDFAGYILVALGAGGLIGVSRQFDRARRFSWILVAVSVVLTLFRGRLASWGWILSVPLDGAMMWFLLGGVSEFVVGFQRADLASRASLYRRGYVGLLVAGVAVLLLAKVLPGLASPLGSIVFVATLVVLAVILYLVHQAKQLSPEVSPFSQPQPEDKKEAA